MMRFVRTFYMILARYNRMPLDFRYEEYLKRAVRSRSKWANYPNFSVTLTTKTLRPISERNKLVWFVKTLQYEWKIQLSQGGTKLAKSHDFNLFSKYRPTRYEVEVDKQFDLILYNQSADEKLSEQLAQFVEKYYYTQ
jgi:hypothetical protein